MLAIGSQLNAQDNILKKKISINLDRSNVVELLNFISDKYKIYFSYDPDILKTEIRNNYKFENETLYEILNVVLDKNIDFKIINNQVILYKKNNTEIKPQTIRGKVVDKDTYLPLIGATVILKNTEPVMGTVTDGNGYYAITNVPVGRQTVVVSFIGYKPITFDNIMLLSAKEKILNVEMEESANDIEEVKVHAYSRKENALNDMATASARSFTIEETEKYAGSWGDPSRMAINYAGVVMAGDERNDIVIRGNSPTGLIWQLEGLPIPSPNHFDDLGATGGPVSILNNNTLSRSDFFTGAFPAEYGNGYSGVFDLHMRNGNYNKYEFMGQLGFAGFEAGAEGPVSRKNKSSFLVNYRYSMLGLVGNMLWISELPHYQDLNYKINIPYKKGNLSLFGFGGSSYIKFNYYYPVEGSDVMWEEVEKSGSKTAFSGINHTHFISDHTRIVNSFAYSLRNPHTDEIFKRNNENMGSCLEYDDFESNYMLSSKIISKINRVNLIKAGIRVEMTKIGSVNYNNSVENDSVIRIKKIDFRKDGLYTIYAFTEFQHKFSDNLTINTGVHYQHFMLNHTQSIEPRFGLKYNYSQKGEIGLAYGNHCQIQPFFTYFFTDSINNYNNKNLDFTRSHQFVLSHDYAFTRNLHLKIEGYYQQLYDVPVLKYDSTFSIIN